MPSCYTPVRIPTALNALLAVLTNRQKRKERRANFLKFYLSTVIVLICDKRRLLFRGEPARVEPGREPVQQVPHGSRQEPPEPPVTQPRQGPSNIIMKTTLFETRLCIR